MYGSIKEPRNCQFIDRDKHPERITPLKTPTAIEDIQIGFQTTITKLPEWDVILHIVALYHVANLHGLYESHVKYVPYYANVRK